MKGFVFYTTTFLLALPLFAIMLLLSPFVLLFDKHRRLAQHFVNNIWAKVSTLLYYRVQVKRPSQIPLMLGTARNRIGPTYLYAGWQECMTPVHMMQIEGKENLPAADSPAVYVSNHQSFMVWFGRSGLSSCLVALAGINVFLCVLSKIRMSRIRLHGSAIDAATKAQ